MRLDPRCRSLGSACRDVCVSFTSGDRPAELAVRSFQCAQHTIASSKKQLREEIPELPSDHQAISAGDPVYTISNEGVRMLYVNPFDCKQPATSLSTWVIEMDQPETVYSIQVSVVDDTIDETEGVALQYISPKMLTLQGSTSMLHICNGCRPNQCLYSILLSTFQGDPGRHVLLAHVSLSLAEAIVVRVGGNNPLEAGASSNSLCTLADVNATSSMLIYDCQAPVSGQFISISRNDAGNMNVCAFTANLGTITFAPADAPGKSQARVHMFCLKD